MTIRNVHVEIDYVGSPTQTKKFSLFPDATANEGRLIGKLNYKVNVKTWIQGDVTNSVISTIELANADGGLDTFADETMTEVRIYEVLDGARTLLATGQVDRAIFGGEDTLKITLKDAKKLLDIPLQTDRFPASETSDSTPMTSTTYYGLEDIQRPVCIGFCRSVPPVLVNRSINEYWVHDEQHDSIVTVFDNGISVTHVDHTTSFVLNADPSGRIVADVQGQQDGLSPIGFIKSIRQVVDYILDKVSITNYSTADLDTIDTDKTYQYAYYQSEKTARNVNEIIQWLCDSHTGWYYTAPDGDIRFGYLQDPAVSADVDIDQIDVIGDINIFDDVAPNIKTRVGASRNWYVYNQDDIVVGATAQNKVDLAQQFRNVKESATALDGFYTSKDEIHDTLIKPGGEAQEEADNVATLYSQKRKFYAFQSSISADIGETVQLTFDRFGLDSGVNLLVVGLEIDFISNEYRLTLWG